MPRELEPPLVVLLMGVSGAGKSTVGASLAERLGCVFVDGDDLHPAASRRKMAAGVPLTDADRLPWLRRVREVVGRHEEAGSRAVIACSALKESYRRLLLDGTRRTRLVYLRGAPALLERRLAERGGHFFDPRLLASQLETLEEPASALTVDVDGEVEEITAAIVAGLA